ncbi:MAG: peptidylprolyl isomerase [Acidobacteria bacterium]|nr:peptidylprolyl isomerase [Acidobacteriota bacterium]
MSLHVFQWRRVALALASLAAIAAVVYVFVSPRLAAQPAVPVIVVETSQGSFAFETFPKEAPVSVEHIAALAKSGFYDGQRVHRAIPHFLVQFGDPQTKDPEKQAVWGKGADASSGHPIGVAEISLQRKNVAFAVGLAHMGEPAKADSQLYILLEPKPDLDGQYVVIGQVVEGREVLGRLSAGDSIRRVSVRE